MSTENSEKVETYCVSCKGKTECTKLKIRKSKNNRLGLSSICEKCGKKKFNFIKKEKYKKFPEDVSKQLSELKPGEKYTGGIIPLLALLPAIFGGIAAASGVAGTVANSVISKKQADEEKRHNEEKEKIMREAAGSGIEEIKKKDKKKTLEEKRDKAIKFLTSIGYTVVIDLNDSDEESKCTKKRVT